MSIATIEGLYVGYFGRAADPAGLNYWLQQEALGLTDTQIATSFQVQTETTTLYPALLTPSLLDASPAAEANFINAIYMDLFGHAADTAGLSFWQGQLTAGVNPGVMVTQIISGAQGTDATAFSSKVGVATSYTNAVLTASPAVTFNKNDITASKSILATVTSPATASATGASISAAIVADQSGNSGVTGVTLTLPNTVGGATITTVNISPTATGTGAQQTVNGANNTIRGLGKGDLNSSVSINGGTGGFNTLNSVVDVAGATGGVVNPILANVQSVNLDPTSNVTFSATGDSGIQLLNEAGGSIAGTTGQTLTVTGLAQSVQVGMSNTTVAGAPIVDNLTVGFTGIAASGNAVTLVLNGNTGGGTFDTTLSSGNGINTYNIQSTGSKVNILTIGATDTALTTDTITGSAALSLTNTNLGTATINGSAATGNLTINAGALTAKAAISGGSGADTINASAATKAVTLSDGGGNDTLQFNGGIAANVINAGAGSDTVQTQVPGAQGLTFISATDTTTNSQLITDVNVLNNYTAGSTKIDLTGASTASGGAYAYDSSLTATQLATATAASSLLTAVNTVAALIHGQAKTLQVVAFSFGGNAYVYQDVSGASTMVAGDGLLQVTGAASTFKVSDLTLA